MTPPLAPVAGDPRLDRLRARLDARRQALGGLRERLEQARGEQRAAGARRATSDALSFRHTITPGVQAERAAERAAAADAERARGGAGLGLTTLRVGIASVVPGVMGGGDAAVEEEIERADPRAIARVVSPALPERTIGAGTEPVFVGPTPARTGADVLGAAAVAGTAAKEYAYLRALSPLGRAVGWMLGKASSAERALFPRLAAKLDELAFRSTATSRGAAAISGAARGSVDAAAFGVGRETLEHGASAESVAHGIAYAPYGTLFGAFFGAAAGRPISLSRAMASPADAARMAELEGVAARMRQAGRLTPDQELELAYRTLGVRAGASEAEISRAFRDRAAQYHPEGRTPNEDAFKLFSAAKEVAVRGARGRAGRRPAEPQPADRPAAEAGVTSPAQAEPAAPRPPTTRPGVPLEEVPEPLGARVRRKVAQVIYPEGPQELRGAQRAAETDAMTGAGNKRAFDRAVARPDPDREIVLFDLNNLKAANELRGHEFGNERIKQVAAAINRGLAEAGVAERVFRLGGDEFAAIVPRGRGEQVRAGAERVYGSVDVGEYKVSLSGRTGATFAEADAALRAGKAARASGEAYRPTTPEATPVAAPPISATPKGRETELPEGARAPATPPGAAQAQGAPSTPVEPAKPVKIRTITFDRREGTVRESVSEEPPARPVTPQVPNEPGEKYVLPSFATGGARPPSEPGVTIGGQPIEQRAKNVDRFIREWEPLFRKAAAENPADYGNPTAEQMDRTVSRIRLALIEKGPGGVSHSETMKAAQRKLGLKPSQSALEEFFKTPAAPATAGFRAPEAPHRVSPKGTSYPAGVPPEVEARERAELSAEGAAPVVQRTIEESGQPASEADLEKLVDAAHRLLVYEKSPTGEPFPRDPRAVRAWVTNVLGRPYESGTWRTDDAYDALEAAINRFVRDEVHAVPTGEVQMRRYLERVRQLEEDLLGTRTRSEGMVARQQFSTPLPIAAGAQFALNVQPGEKVLEPTAGTGNLVVLLPKEVEVRANEVDPRRAALLRQLGVKPTTDDALGLYLKGVRVNAVVMNPPFGGVNLPKYKNLAVRGALPFPASDISQRFVYAALQSLAPGGRLVAIMPEGMMGKSAVPFRSWLREHFNVQAMIESPEGSYVTRGTKFGTWMLVVDNTGRAALPDPVYRPSWERWTTEVLDLGPTGGLARRGGHEPVADVAPVRGAEPAARAPVRPAPLAAVEPPSQPSGVAPPQEATRDAVPAEPDAPPAAPASVARGDREAAPVAGGGERGAQPGGPTSEPGVRPPARAERDPGVVAEPPPREPREAGAGTAPALVPRLARRRIEPGPGDSPERRRELSAANDSPVFAPYARGIEVVRNPHPRLVVETRAMAGMPAPALAVTQFQSPLVQKAWARPGAEGGISDDQADAALHALSAWRRDHGFLLADDVGVGKTREAAILILEALAQGRKRILYTTKNENNVGDVMRELRLVATGDERGDFPALFIVGAEYAQAMNRSGRMRSAGLPEPDGAAIYLVHSYNFEPLAESLLEVRPDTWLADEAHEYKNPFSKRGMAWQRLHTQMLNDGGLFGYFTATPAVTLDELGYLYGLKEWRPGGFADWVRRKLGKEDAESTGDETESERDAEAARREEEVATGDRSGIATQADEAAGGKVRFMRERVDAFQSKITPAETEQVMRELKGQGKYLARDLWRGGVTFEVHTVDLVGAAPAARAARARYDEAAALVREITMAARKFGYFNKQVKTVGLERAMIQSYMKQLLFDLRLPSILKLADEAIGQGKQVVISVHSVAGDVDVEEGLSEADAEVPLNKRLESAINRINTRQVEKQGEGDEAEFVDLGAIPEALAVRAALLSRLAELPPLKDPVRAVEEHFGAKNVAPITGKASATQRTKYMQEFQGGRRTVALISKAGKVGISLHDVNGKARRMIVGDYEWSADLFKQELGRVDRTGQRSSPEIILVASNIAGERKFAATIAARMATLGATSKGSAEATGTDALDQFEMSDNVALAAMKLAVERMPDDAKQFFTGSKYVEAQATRQGDRIFRPKFRPDDADMRSFLLEMLMFPVEEANAALEAWVAARAELMTGEAVEAQAARRTGKLSGKLLRVTDLGQDPPVTMFEVENDAGEHRAIVQGFVTRYIAGIQEARGTDESGNRRPRRYVQFTEAESGELISGLELAPAEARRVKRWFGKGERKAISAADAWQDLQTSEDVRVDGPEGDEWTLHPRRDGRLQIKGATLARHRGALQGYATYEPVGNFLYVQNEQAAVTKFLERFPPKQPEAPSAQQRVMAHMKEAAEAVRTKLGRAPLEDLVDGWTRNSLMEKLEPKVPGIRRQINAMDDEALVELALQHGMLDDVTIGNIERMLEPFRDERGFLRVGREPTAADLADRYGPPPGTEGAARVLAEHLPRRVGFLENWVFPPSRVAKRMQRDADPLVRDIGKKVGEIVDAGQAADQRFGRLIEFGSLSLQEGLTGLSKAERADLVRRWLAAEDAGLEGLPAGTPEKIAAAFSRLRGDLRQTWRWLGENERVMLSTRSRGILDAAIEEWPEGSTEFRRTVYDKDGEIVTPGTFDTTPINRANILAAAKRAKGLRATPTTREGWMALYGELRGARKRVQRPVFMDSPDLRRIFDMIQGRGDLASYFPHVFKGDWVVRAGDKTARFVNRQDAIDYARRLLREESWPTDLVVRREGWMPEAELYLSRKAYFRLRASLENAAGEEAAVVGMDQGRIRIRPRRRFYSHLQRRETNLQTFEHDVVAALRTYYYRTAKKLAFDPFRKVALDLRDQLPFDGRWRDFADGYIADVQGVPHEWVENVNASIERLSGGLVGPFALQRAASRWQHAMSWWHLGYSPVSAVVNVTQTFINTLPAFPKDGEKWVWTGARALAHASEESRRVLDGAGIRLQHPKYLAGEYLPRGLSVNEDAWFMPMYLFNKAEDVNRGVAALAKYAEQRSLGRSEAAAIAAAKALVYSTQFDYSMADSPRIMRNPVGRALFQFKQFPINQLLFAEDLFRWGTPRQRAKFAAYLFVFGGLNVLLKATPLFLLNWLLGQTGLFRDDTTGEKQTPLAALWEELRKADLDVGAEPLLAAIKYGVLALLGVQISERVGFGGPREFNSTIPGSKMKQVADALRSTNPTERERAMRVVLPSAVRRLTDAYEAAETGRIRDRYGRTVDDSVSLTDIVGAGLGIQTVEQGERFERLDRERATVTAYRDRRSDFLDRAARALARDGADAALRIVDEARRAGVRINIRDVRERRDRVDESDVRRRVERTPRDVRDDLFTPEERAGTGRRPPGAPRPPSRPRRQ